MNTDELNFAYKVRQALNESLDNFSPSTLKRLASARNAALSAKKQEVSHRALATAGSFSGKFGDKFGSFLDAPFSWLQSMGLAVPVIVLMVGLVGIYQFEQQERISETAEIDALVLSDELPLSAYADRGFNAYLSNRGRS